MNHTPKVEIQPDENKKKFMDLNFGMFIHYGINTFYDTEISDGDLPLYNFDPPGIDTDKWCSTAKNAGMKYILMTAKSMDGFCNWPSKYSNYTVKQTPYKRDILASMVNSAEKYGLRIGFSYSLWDNYIRLNNPSDLSYEYFIMHQLEELLTSYGPLVEIWLDGFWKRQSYGWRNDQGFPAPQKKFLQAWRLEGAFRWRWDYLYGYLKSLQSNCLVFVNSTRAFPGLPLLPVDGRNAEKGVDTEEDEPVWAWLGDETYLPLQIETTLSQKGQGNFLDGNWYWHKWDKSVAKKWQVNTWRKRAEKLKANLLLNVGPSISGSLRPEDEKLLSKLSE